MSTRPETKGTNYSGVTGHLYISPPLGSFKVLRKSCRSILWKPCTSFLFMSCGNLALVSCGCPVETLHEYPVDALWKPCTNILCMSYGNLARTSCGCPAETLQEASGHTTFASCTLPCGNFVTLQESPVESVWYPAGVSCTVKITVGDECQNRTRL